MRIGFVGIGTIAEAIIEGVVKSSLAPENIVISPRNKDIAGRLAARHDVVRIAGTNQAVVDASDMVFIAVRPQVAEDVIRDLRFRPGQQVVSLVATVSADQLRGWLGEEVTITQAMPLPFAENLQGVTAVFPPRQEVMDFFTALGTAIAMHSKEEFDLTTVASSLMGTYFGLLDGIADWFSEKGMPEENTRSYVAKLFATLSQIATQSPHKSLSALRHEYSTRGGLNEQLYHDFADAGGVDALKTALQNVHQRIRGA
jgi:pyrroline-5-carboxylate reductase